MHCATCHKPTPYPYAREVDGLVFDQRQCWEQWRADRNRAQVGQLTLNFKEKENVVLIHAASPKDSG